MAAFEAALTEVPQPTGWVRCSPLSGWHTGGVSRCETAADRKSRQHRSADIAEIATLRVRGSRSRPSIPRAVGTKPVQRRPTHLNVELKPTGHASRLIEACRPLLEPLVTHAHVDLVVSSFDPRVIAAAFDLEVPWRLAFLLESEDALSFLPILEARGGLDLHPRYDLITPEFLQRYSRSGTSGMSQKVRTWTVDDESTATAP